MEEVWVPIKGYFDRYQLSNKGNIKGPSGKILTRTVRRYEGAPFEYAYKYVRLLSPTDKNGNLKSRYRYVQCFKLFKDNVPDTTANGGVIWSVFY
jgi:hypothetical protein